ncbi:MAG: flagellar biosynthesis anti-sigma factor FlgM [Dehalococcoidia bacterium]
MLQPIRPQDAGQIYQRQVTSSEATPASPRRIETAASHGGAGRRTDRAMFSPAALEMSRALSAVTDAPDVRMGRVEALRAAIENGTYRIDADGIASALVEQGFAPAAGPEGGAS